MTVCRYMPVLGTDRAHPRCEGISWKILELGLLVTMASESWGSPPIVSTDYVRRREPSFLIAVKVFLKAALDSLDQTAVRSACM